MDTLTGDLKTACHGTLNSILVYAFCGNKISVKENVPEYEARFLEDEYLNLVFVFSALKKLCYQMSVILCL